MDNTIQFPDGYRYNSDMELFKIAVDCTKDMLERKEMIILYQFIDEILAEVFISQDDFEQEYNGIGWNDFIDILNSEIIYLLRQNFEEAAEKDTDLGLKSFLNEKKVPEELQEKIIKLKLDKGRYVSMYLGGDKERNRYNLKNRFFLKRLSDMDYELSRTKTACGVSAGWNEYWPMVEGTSYSGFQKRNCPGAELSTPADEPVAHAVGVWH